MIFSVKMNKHRCVNCGICLDQVDSLEFNALKYTAPDLSPDLSSVHEGHINKLCHECYDRMENFIIKTETEFVSVEDNNESDKLLDTSCVSNIKTEPDCLESNNEVFSTKKIYIEETENMSNQNILDGIFEQNSLEDINEQISLEDINEQNSLEDINVQNSSEDLNEQSISEDLNEQNSSEDLNEQNSSEDLNEQSSSEDLNEQNSSEDLNEQNSSEDINEQNNLEIFEVSDLSYSEEECIPLSNTNNEDECIEYEYIEESPPYVEHPPKPENVKRKWNGNRKNDDSDEDYVPNIKIPKVVSGQRKSEENESIEIKDTLKLSKYSRTLRIGRCIFNGCEQECISLIPRTVRRRMIMEYNVYIPPLSRVCEEHLQDQNWEELLSNTTKEFTAQYCQDMKNIIKEACCTNFDFENIETVEARLVRYWFDVNKTEFNRIFSYFPKLKHFKQCKTVLALYLMHLQKTSAKRIALLLKMDEKMVKRIIRIGGDIVQCDSYSKLKEKFLEDD